MNRIIRVAVLSFLSVTLVGCANNATTPGDGAVVRQASASPVLADMAEKQVDSIAAIAGAWKGRLYAGPLNGRAMQVSIKPDGSWTNDIAGAGKFYGTVSVADGRIRAKSKSTGTMYVWRLYEGKQDAKKRALVWLIEGSHRHFATTESAGGH